MIESKHPELNGLLLTAVQQQLEPGQNPGYLQYRVLQEATARSQEQDWREYEQIVDEQVRIHENCCQGQSCETSSATACCRPA